ncbi:MAG: FAD:protein FMN transferase [Clostridia bacterium]|nr:FAD:protein FMN transferase [Clostridia bacterium]
MKKLSVKLFAALFALTLVLSACGGGGEYRFTAFNGVDVTVQMRNKLLSAAAKTEIEDLLESLNAEFSATAESSTVYKINSAAAGERVAVSARFKEIADDLTELFDLTEGRFDISVYPLTILWQFAPAFPVAKFSVPQQEDIDRTLSVCGSDKFSFGEFAVKSASGAKIDFGGCLKGYAADEIAKIIKQDGATAGFINVGGSSLNLLYVDNLAIKHPRQENERILSVKIKAADLSVSTSGDYEKTYTSGGKTYSHIIDPKNGKPIDGGVASATVIGKNGLKLDALSTALCVCSHDFNIAEQGDLYRFIKKILSNDDYKDAQIFAVCTDGENKQILTNKKQGEDFALLDNDFSVIYVA